MKSFNDIREKTLTPAELKKREEIAKAMERDNPGMDMGKKMAIATATAKRVAEKRDVISIGSADKKPENFRDQDGKMKVRMVPVKKTQIQYEAVDYDKLTQLARFGLVDKGNVQKLIAAFKKMEDGKILAPQQRELMLNVLTDLTGIITGDAQMFQKAKKAVKEGTFEEAMDHFTMIAESDAVKKAAGFATWNKRDPKTGKLLNNEMEEVMKQKLFMFKTKAEAEAHAKKHGGKVVSYTPTNHAVLDKDLTKKPGKKPDGMVKEANMTAAQKAKFDALYKQHLNGKQHKILRQTIQNPIKADSAYHSMIKTLAMKEDTQIDEISQGKLQSYHAAAGADLQKKREKLNKGTLTMKDLKGGQNRVKGLNRSADKMSEDTQIDEISMGKMAAYAPKAVKSRNDAKSATHSADSNRVTNAKKVIAKRKAGADNYNKKMWGYANVAPTKESVDEGVYTDDLPDTRKKWKDPTSIPRKISHSEIMKAIGHTQSSAQGMAILQKKFKLTAAQARKHMDMFLKDDVQIDEMGAFMSSPLPTPMSMRKDPPMTKPLMLTKRMNTAAALIKKAGNTPVRPTAEATYSDTGWQKPEVKKDQSGNVIKTKNVAKTLAKSGLRRTKDLEAAQKAKYLTFSKVKK